MISPLAERSDGSATAAAGGTESDVRGPATEAMAVESPQRGYSLVIRDISGRHEASERHRLAHTCDQLTGLIDRRSFYEAAEIEIARWRRTPRPMSLVRFDADQVRQINDRHGPGAGDAVLGRLARALQAAFRSVDIVARIGGDEFAVLLPSTDLHGATALADRLRETVAADRVDVGSELVSCTVSGGVAAMAAQFQGLDAWLKRADSALDAAIAAGRNRVVAGGES